jgi:hypothetical protein
MKRGISLLSGLLGLALVTTSLPAYAATPVANPVPSDFNLQVTPSPLVTTVKPGVKSQVELKIRNGGSGAEDLKIEPRSFKFDSKTGKVALEDNVTPPVTPWITFSAPKFTVQPGQWYSEQVGLNFPKDTGFSYSFALVVSRQNNPKPAEGQRAINGSLAVFTLVNVDRPGATSKLDVVSFTTSKHVYEYLPATVDVRFRNSGNTIVQPYGDIFIQRNADAKKPISTLKVNETQGYILPGTERSVNAQWKDGFAVYQTQTDASGKESQHLTVDWSKLKQFRIGRYTAKMVAVYSDGQHDVPIVGTVTFWVVPWRAILGTLVIIVLLYFFFRWRSKRRTEKAVKRALAAHEAAQKAPAKPKTPEGTV